DATLTVVTVVGLRTLLFTLGAFLGTFLLGLGTLLGTFGVRLVRGQCLVGVRGRTGLWVGRVLRGRYVPGLVLGVEGVVVLLLGLDDDVVGPLASVVDPWFVLAGDLTEFTQPRGILLGEDRSGVCVEGLVVRLLGLDDDVVGPLASVVEPWFVLAGDLTEFTPRRDIVLGEDRTALVVDQVARSGDHSVTVGVDQVSVQPVVLVVRGALQLADGDDRVGQVTFTVLVAVDLQHVRELVEATDLLHLLERLGDDGRVDKTHTRDGVGLGRKFLAGQLGGRVVGLYLGVRDVVRLACA